MARVISARPDCLDYQRLKHCRLYPQAFEGTGRKFGRSVQKFPPLIACSGDLFVADRAITVPRVQQSVVLLESRSQPDQLRVISCRAYQFLDVLQGSRGRTALPVRCVCSCWHPPIQTEEIVH